MRRGGSSKPRLGGWKRWLVCSVAITLWPEKSSGPHTILELAGDRAALTFANDEARASYSWAIELLGSDPAHAVQVAEIWLKLGRLAWRLGHFEDSRAAFVRAAGLASTDAAFVAARSLCLLAAVETAGHRHEAALGALEAAEEKLLAWPDQGSDEWAEIWVDVQLNEATSTTGKTNPRLRRSSSSGPARSWSLGPNQAKGRFLQCGYFPASAGQQVPHRRQPHARLPESMAGSGRRWARERDVLCALRPRFRPSVVRGLHRRHRRNWSKRSKYRNEQTTRRWRFGCSRTYAALISASTTSNR